MNCIYIRNEIINIFINVLLMFAFICLHLTLFDFISLFIFLIKFMFC